MINIDTIKKLLISKMTVKVCEELQWLAEMENLSAEDIMLLITKISNQEKTFPTREENYDIEYTED